MAPRKMRTARQQETLRKVRQPTAKPQPEPVKAAPDWLAPPPAVVAKPRKRVNWIWLVPMAGAAWLIVTLMRAFPL